MRLEACCWGLAIVAEVNTKRGLLPYSLGIRRVGEAVWRGPGGGALAGFVGEDLRMTGWAEGVWVYMQRTIDKHDVKGPRHL